MRVLAGFGAALVLAATQFVSAAAPATARTLLAVSSSTSTRTLLHVDARTLMPVDDRSVTLEPTSGPLLRSPDKSLLAVATGGTLNFFDTVQMVKTGALGVPSVSQLSPVAWPVMQRLFVLGFGAAKTEVLIVDPVSQTLVTRKPLPEGNASVVALPNGIVYLAWPYNGIFPARVAVVGLDGAMRSVTVGRISAGIHWHRVRGVQVGDISQPGLTADTSGTTAYLVGAKNLIAEIDLASLAVTYHALVNASTRSLARVEKALNGPTRYARCLGNGQLAISGTNAKITVGRNKSVKETWTPVGVAVVDTRTWHARMIDSAAGGFVVADNVLVVPTAHAVKAYEADGTLRFSRTIDDNIGYAVAFGGYAYVWGDHDATILDLESGAVVAVVPNPHLYVIGADD